MNLFKIINRIFYLPKWRILDLWRFKNQLFTVLKNTRATLSGAIVAMREAGEEYLNQAKVELKLVIRMEEEEWPKLAYITDSLGNLVARIYPFVTNDQWHHALGKLWIYVGALVFFTITETFLYALIAAYLLPGAKPMSLQGLTLALALASIGTFFTHAGIQLTFDLIDATGYYKEKKIDRPKLIKKSFWGLIGVLMLVATFLMAYNAGGAREAYFALSAAKDPAKKEIYESLNLLVLTLTMGMPLLLAYLKHASRDSFLTLRLRKSVLSFESKRGKLLTSVERRLNALDSRLSEIFVGSYQLILDMFETLGKCYDSEHEQLAKDLIEELRKNPRIDEAFFRRFESVYGMSQDLFDYAISRDPRYVSLMQQISEQRALLNRLEGNNFRKPFEVKSAEKEQAPSLNGKSQKNNFDVNSNALNVIFLGIFFLAASGCTKVAEMSSQISELTKEGQRIVVGVDMSASSTTASDAYNDVAIELLSNLKPGSSIYFLAVHSASQTASEEIFFYDYSVETDDKMKDYTDAAGIQDENYQRRKKIYFDSLSTELKSRLDSSTIRSRQYAQNTDLIGFLNLGKRYLSKIVKKNQLILLSDGLIDSDGVKMKGDDKVDELLSQVEGVNFADTDTPEIAFFLGKQGVTYTQTKLRNTEKFWRKYSEINGLYFRGFYSTSKPLINDIYTE